MNIRLQKMLSLAEEWSEEERDELAQVALEIEARRHGVYHATEEELKAIDEGLADAERGNFASAQEIEAIFAKFRRA
jgi:predicted transcriptional regulator